jgi:DNA-binding transcriptional regulator YdaS (Cro superfamily)
VEPRKVRKTKRANHKLKGLSAYLSDKCHSEFATTIGIQKSYLSMILSGTRKAPLRIASRITLETEFEVTLKELRPDIYDAVMKCGEKNNGKG